VQVMLKTAAFLDRLPFPEVPHGEEGLIETIWLLLTSVIAVPLVCKLPGGSPVLGFLVRLFFRFTCTHWDQSPPLTYSQMQHAVNRRFCPHFVRSVNLLNC